MDGSALTLEVMIATCGPDGGRKVAAMNLPVIPGVKYLVSWQEPGENAVPDELASRDDVRIIFLKGYGLSRNRNNCFDNATGDILLIADDDLEFYPDGLSEIRRIFKEHPELEYGSFRYDSDVPKFYPQKESSLARLPKGFSQSSVEIALRRESLAGKLRFNEDFGLGAPVFTAGEEELFLKKARNNGLHCRFFPVTIANHPGATTGVRECLADGALLARGAVTVVEYPLTAVLRIPLGAWRVSRARQAGFFKALCLMIAGALKVAFGNSVKPYLESPM